MFKIDEKARYAKTHEWMRLEGGIVVVGVSDYAQDKLSDIVFVDLPPVGKEVKKDSAFLVIESVKAAEDVFAPVSGVVTEVNADLSPHPELVNKDPFGQGWLVRIKPADANEAGSSLMDAKAYKAYLESL
jgi:glycine cleavage system H protein